MRASIEIAVPLEVLAKAQQHAGQEGGVGGRPGSAEPSSLARARQGGGTGGVVGSAAVGGETPVPLDVLQHARQYEGQKCRNGRMKWKVAGGCCAC